MNKNLICIHCGKDISNEYYININSYTTMGPVLYEKYIKKQWLWEGINTNQPVCQDCFRKIDKLIKNESCISKVKKHKKEHNCPDCKLNINSCNGCPRYRNK